MSVDTSDNTRYLIVSADDFGYFRCVSQGILDSHLRGVVTATAIFGNAPNLEQLRADIVAAPDLDMGVHLNLTFGEPLSGSLRSRLSRSEGQFPSKFHLIGMLFARKITPADIELEWTLQIERCVQHGMRPCFLNSHEHVHMLPGLAAVAGRVAERFQIEHIRISCPDPIRLGKPSALLRDVGLQLLTPGAERIIGGNERITFLGTAVSGRLSFEYLKKRLPLLAPGRVYELMCHPGYYDPKEILDDRLLAYHDWERELAVLTSTETCQLLQACNIRLIGYRHLTNVHRKELAGR
jgi:predicted glycoside hydrolase/deacetylase ChbG (UPF0249 family)